MTVDHPMTVTAKNIAFGNFSEQAREGLRKRSNIRSFGALVTMVKFKQLRRAAAITLQTGTVFLKKCSDSLAVLLDLSFFSPMVCIVICELSGIVSSIPFGIFSQGPLALSKDGVLASSIALVLSALSNPFPRISSCDVGVFVRHPRTITGSTYYSKQFLCQGVI